MKLRLLTIACFLMAGITLQAQTGLKQAKAAGRALTSYNVDPSNSNDKLAEAVSKIDAAMKESDFATSSQAWIIRGDIYKTRLQRDMNRMMIDTSAQLTGENDAMVAYEAYKKGLEFADKGYRKKDAKKGIAAVQNALVTIGAWKYEQREYAKSYDSWVAALESHEYFEGSGEKSMFDDPAQMEEQRFYTALVAQLAEKNDEAIAMFEALRKEGTKRSTVYESLYALYNNAKKEDLAAKALAEGREKFPDDTALLFTEINDYLVKGKLDELIGRLKEAIDKEPDNVSLYVTIGNVYDNLYQREVEAKNEAKANEYFNNALDYYKQGGAKDPKNADVQYSIGALYYNKAAIKSQELVAMENDFSSEGLKKAADKKKEMMDLFDLALPYFKQAEKLNPNEQGTLTALSEIYARKEDYTKMKEFKRRMDVIKSGGSNDDSYFENN